MNGGLSAKGEREVLETDSCQIGGIFCKNHDLLQQALFSAQTPRNAIRFLIWKFLLWAAR